MAAPSVTQGILIHAATVNDYRGRYRKGHLSNSSGFTTVHAPCVCLCVLQYLPSTAVNTTLQLQELRERMLPLNISAYIIPGTDAHLVDQLSIIISPYGFNVCVCDGERERERRSDAILCFPIRASISHHVMREWPSWPASQAQQVRSISASLYSSSSSSSSFSSPHDPAPLFPVPQACRSSTFSPHPYRPSLIHLHCTVH